MIKDTLLAKKLASNNVRQRVLYKNLKVKDYRYMNIDPNKDVTAIHKTAKAILSLMGGPSENKIYTCEKHLLTEFDD